MKQKSEKWLKKRTVKFKILMHERTEIHTVSKNTNLDIMSLHCQYFVVMSDKTT